MFLAIGVGALLVALALTLVLLRLNRTLFVVEALIETMTQEMRETLPEVRESLGNVNEIASGMNSALQSAGTGLGAVNGRVRRVLHERALDAAAAWYGMRVAGRRLTEAYAEQELMNGRAHVDVSDVPNPVNKEDEHGQR
jgi:predicted MFS family arabinose efflux permease